MWHNILPLRMLGRRISDKNLTQESTFLSLLEPGDSNSSTLIAESPLTAQKSSLRHLPVLQLDQRHILIIKNIIL